MSLERTKKLRNVITCSSKQLAVLLWESGDSRGVRIVQVADCLSQYELARLGKEITEFAESVAAEGA